MLDEKCGLILLTGKKHSGKTTVLKRLVEGLKREGLKISGFTAPSVYDSNFLSGFDLVDIQSGRSVKFARWKTAAQAFQFSDQGLEFGRKILESEEARNADLIIIDEFGPLELEGDGWRKDTDSLLENKNCLLLVIREELVEAVKELYSGLSCRVFPAVEQSIENIKQLLEKPGEKRGEGKNLR